MQPWWTGLILASALVLSACGRSDTGTATGPVVTDPISQTTELWTVDRPTEDWFTAWCDALTSLPSAAEIPQDDTVATLTRLGDTLVTTSARLGSMPPPTFDGAAEFAAHQVGTLASAGAAFHEAAQQWDDGHTGDARTTVDQAVSSAHPAPDSLDPVVGAQVRNLPACQSVTPTF